MYEPQALVQGQVAADATLSRVCMLQTSQTVIAMRLLLVSIALNLLQQRFRSQHTMENMLKKHLASMV